MHDGYAFTHDPGRCIKCYSCETACKQWKEIPPGSFRLRRVYEVVSGTFPNVTRTFHSEACRHCPDALCIAACTPGAISKREADGVVLVQEAKCNGCRKCAEACPFGVAQFDDAGILQLCDLCQDRLARGSQPMCTDACPTGALRFNRGGYN